jgi:hypothetical protein
MQPRQADDVARHGLRVCLRRPQSNPLRACRIGDRWQELGGDQRLQVRLVGDELAPRHGIDQLDHGYSEKGGRLEQKQGALTSSSSSRFSTLECLMQGGGKGSERRWAKAKAKAKARVSRADSPTSHL